MRLAILTNPRLGIALRWVLSLAILLTFAKLDSYYEQDELAKVAQVRCLAKEPSIFHLHEVPDYYRRDLFSAFYLIATAFYKATPLDAVQAVNLLSVLCGAFFFALAPWLFSRILGIPAWLIFAVLLNVPALTVTFCYGNEAAVALCAITLAACLMTRRSRIGHLLAAAAFCVAVFARTDYLLLFPALALLGASYRDGVIDIRASLRSVLVLGGGAMVIGLAYLAIVIKGIPKADYFEYHTDPKLFCAFIVYGAGLSTMACAVLGFVDCVIRRRWSPMIFLILPLQFAPYAAHLTSPKYILPTLVAIAAFAVLGMEWLVHRSAWLCAATLLLPWFVSVTPYGVSATPGSALWYIPTDAGPIPTGGYLWFYAKIKSGFYQQRYDQELEQMAQAMPILESSPNGAALVGYFQPGTLRVWSTEHRRWDIPPEHVSFMIDELAPETARRNLMLKTSYLYDLKLIPKSRDQLSAYCSIGQITGISGENAPFPNVIETGPLIPPNRDLNLGRRIRFMNERSGGEQWIGRNSLVREYDGLAWITSSRYQENAAAYPQPIYSDEEWVCFSESVPHAIYYSLRFPLVYAKSRPKRNIPLSNPISNVPPEQH